MDQTGLKWFDTLQLARQYLDNLDADNNGMFVYQKFGGRRRFLVTSYLTFVDKYLGLPEERCHFYEVITTDTPCKLYFDVDIYQDRDQSLRWKDLVDHLISYVNHCLMVMYQRECKKTEVILLDSSTEEKFSQHIIYPHIFFRNNQECGYFVKKIADAARAFADGTGLNEFTEAFPLPRLDELFISKGSRSGTYFLADLTVYSRNRHFRLLRSSRLNIEVPFLIADESEYFR